MGAAAHAGASASATSGAARTAVARTAVAASDASATEQTPIAPVEAQTLDMLLGSLPASYARADSPHDTRLAAPIRLIARELRDRVRESAPSSGTQTPAPTARALASLDQLVAMLRPTDRRFQPWPLALEVSALSARARGELQAALHPPAAPAHTYGALGAALDRVSAQARSGGAARFAVLHVYALYAADAGRRLQSEDPALDARITQALLSGHPGAPALLELAGSDASSAQLAKALAGVRADVSVAGQLLGLVQIGHATIVINGAIIVFREGLEAVLILAAITASFVGAKRRLRRPVLLGALAGLGATIVTFLVGQTLLHLFGNGGLQLQAVTGVVAIAVLLLVTNWFFHRLYWSEWISRFNRRRKALERFDGRGFVSGQVLGLLLLGISSVYREGLETVLFLQALQTSAGTGATALGAGIGLGATLIVGAVTFRLQRKLPFKRMLVLTGVLIALVLAVMVGTTVHTMQGIGWLPITTTSFAVPLNWSTWLGVYPTWEGIFAQLGALVFVLGSYFAAREIQVNRPRRRALRDQAGPARTAAGGAASAAAAAPAQRAV
jgi:high-affinity iron transporter